MKHSINLLVLSMLAAVPVMAQEHPEQVSGDHVATTASAWRAVAFARSWPVNGRT